MASNAVPASYISRIVGYMITKGNFATTSPNLPQSIAVLGEANDASQGTLNLTPAQYTSAQQVGNAYGYGSPLYAIARILFPLQGQSQVGAIPVWFYPQAVAGGAQAKKVIVTPTGTATANVTHYLNIAGRENLDGQSYALNISAGDGATQISGYIANAVNNILGSPVIGANFGYDTMLTTKWSGLTANGLVVTVDTNNNAAGITYSVTNYQNGSATPSIAAQLANFGNQWNTIVINPYGTDAGTVAALESTNGYPDPVNPTGRYAAIIMKPFIALTGSVADNDTNFTNADPSNVTIAMCPAPLSPAFAFEAAANMCVLFAVTSQNTPNLDVAGMFYPDMPVPINNATIGTMATYLNRNLYVSQGNSTVNLVAGRYKIEDFVTTYHPTGENPPQFRYCRNIMLDMNIRYTYYLLEQINVVGHQIAADADQVSQATNTIKPKQWNQLLQQMALDLASRGLIVQPAFMQNSIVVNLSTNNPDRLETFFQYKRSGFVRIASTTAQAGFNFGIVS